MAILALTNPTYQPAMRIIESITNAKPSVVTTTFDHNYLTGEIVRLRIPQGWGMQQADGLKGTITVTGDTTFEIDIDTTHFDAFITRADNPIGVTPGPINIPGGANQLQLNQIFVVNFDVFRIFQLGAGVATTTSSATVTCSIDSTTNPNTVTFVGAAAGLNVKYYVSQPNNLAFTSPQVIPLGEVNNQLRAATKNVLRSPR